MLFLSYNNEEVQDGLGAQLHRIFAIYSIAKSTKIGYLHQPIIKILNHPLDHFSSQDLTIINELFKPDIELPNIEKVTNLIEKKVHVLDKKVLKWYRKKAKNQNINLRITNPFPCINNSPNYYLNIRHEIKFTNSKPQSLGKKTLVIHFRQGIRKTENLMQPVDERYLDIDYFIDIVKRVSNLSNYEIKILTDLPSGHISFKVDESDLHYWTRFGYKLDDNKLINYQGIDLSKTYFGKLQNVSVITNGGPLFALECMASADILIMSRSSLSFVGALLNNQGVIVYPPNFSARKLKHWRRSSAFNEPMLKVITITFLHYFRILIYYKKKLKQITKCLK